MLLRVMAEPENLGIERRTSTGQKLSHALMLSLRIGQACGWKSGPVEVEQCSVSVFIGSLRNPKMIARGTVCSFQYIVTVGF